MAYLESLVKKKAEAEWLPVQGDHVAWPTQEAFLDRLSQVLECPYRPITLAQAFESSERLDLIHRSNLSTVLLLDLTRCRIREVTEWVMASLSDIDRKVDLSAKQLQLVVVTGYSQLDPALAPDLRHDARAISITNFTAEQSDGLLRRAAGATPPMEFDEGARRAVFEFARGDKYYTNCLATFCQRLATDVAGGEATEVDEKTVRIAARSLAGNYELETRILPGFVRAVADHDEVARAVDMLYHDDGVAWGRAQPLPARP